MIGGKGRDVGKRTQEKKKNNARFATGAFPSHSSGRVSPHILEREACLAKGENLIGPAIGDLSGELRRNSGMGGRMRNILNARAQGGKKKLNPAKLEKYSRGGRRGNKKVK